jgi:signal transduction histidine kinase/FixJ family two-component response regulator
MKKKILVIDNDILILNFIDDILSREGHHLVKAEGGLAALDILETYTPDIIIVDLVMPNIDGKKMCKIIRGMEKLKDVYLVILSGAIAESEIDVSELGADICIAKGPMNEMARNIVDVIDESSHPLSRLRPLEVVGIEKIQPRVITKELLSVASQFEIILEKISEGILKVNSQGRIVFANSRALSMCNRPEEKLLGSQFAELFDENVINRVNELMHEKKDKAKPLTEELPLPLNTHQVTLDILPMNGDGGSVIVVLNDVKWRKKEEKEKKNLEAQLQHAQKMESIGTMAGGVAHNFRNIMAGILASSELIQMKWRKHPDLLKYAKGISSAVEKGVHLVNGLMQFSQRKGAETMKVLNLSEIIRETYALIISSFDKNIDIHLDLPELIPVAGDPSALSQVFMNLFTNARDAMPDGGRLEIAARENGDGVEVIVSDTGCGMDKEVREKCFDPFFTTKRFRKGTGLGLSTSYGIVKDHGGEILVHSEPGKGTAFKLCFPLASGEVTDEKGEDMEIIRGAGEKILVVDDEIEILGPMKDLLETSGFRVKLALGGKGAIERYRIWKPDLVLMDISMPEMDGITCVREILAYDHRAPIVIMSGYDEAGLKGLDDVVKKCIIGHVTKPVTIGRLSNVLAGVLKKGLSP